jgi:hypothetical protein
MGHPNFKTKAGPPVPRANSKSMAGPPAPGAAPLNTTRMRHPNFKIAQSLAHPARGRIAAEECKRVKPQLHPDYTVSAFCEACRVVTHFSQVHSTVHNSPHQYKGTNYQRFLYQTLQCAKCHRGALATISDNGSGQTAVLESFFPVFADQAPLPSGVPTDIQTEFREAESCASFGANRAASALFRSVLEKTLKTNGYVKGNDPSLTDLQKRIDAAAADGVITDARRMRAHSEIRSLGNDVLHDDWREVTDDEVEESHRYMQRILEDLYDDRVTVEKILKTKKRIP